MLLIFLPLSSPFMFPFLSVCPPTSSTSSSAFSHTARARVREAFTNHEHLATAQSASTIAAQRIASLQGIGESFIRSSDALRDGDPSTFSSSSPHRTRSSQTCQIGLPIPPYRPLPPRCSHRGVCADSYAACRRRHSATSHPSSHTS